MWDEADQNGPSRHQASVMTQNSIGTAPAPQTISLARDGVVTRHNFQRLGLQRVLRGAYAVAPSASGDEWAHRRADWLNRVRAVMAFYGNSEVVLYGATALQVLGVQLPERLQDWTRVHVLVGSAARRPTRAGVVAHCAVRPIRTWRRIDGLPVLNPVEHWLQMSGATLNEMVEIGDGFVRRRGPLMTRAKMRKSLDGCAGLRGVKLAEHAFKLVMTGTDSIYETRTRLVLVDAGLPTPSVNPSIWCPSVGMAYHADMGYEQARVAVEYDGLVHVGDRFQMTIDADRRRNLQDAGWLIITVTAAGLRQPQDIVRSVENALILRAGRSW